MQLGRQLQPATTTGHQQQRSGQQLSILQLSGGTSPTTLDNWQQIDQHQSAGSSLQQQKQEQQTTCDGQLFGNNELFMIQHQADSSEQPRDPPTSATTRRESQRSSLEVIAEALNRQKRRGRRHLSPQPILTPLSTSSVGEMHQSQRSNNDNNDNSDRRDSTTRTTKEEEERQPLRQRRRLPQDVKKEEGSEDNKKEDIKRETTTTTKKKEETKKEETTKKEERKVKEEEGRGEEDRQRRRRRPSSQQQRWTTATTMTATIFFSIFFSLFIFHLPRRAISESTGSTEEVGASSSSTSNLGDIKQRLVNSIKDLLDIDIEHNNDLDNKKHQQQTDNNIMSVPTNDSSNISRIIDNIGAASTSTSHHQLGQLRQAAQQHHQPISLKLKDNNLYQTASTSLLNCYDNFSSILYHANNTLINLNVETPLLEASQRLRQQHEASATEHGDNINIRVVHLPHRSGASSLPTT